MERTWFSRLELAHSTRGRVRWRYRCTPGMPGDAKSIECATQNIAGVTDVRANARIGSLVIGFDARLTTADAILAALMTLAPAQVSSLAQSGANKGDDQGGLSQVVSSLLTLAGTQYLPPRLQLPVSLGTALPLFRHAMADLVTQGLTSHVLEALAVAISIARCDYLAANTTNFMLALGEYLEDSIARRSDDLLKHLLHPVSAEVWVEKNGTEVLTPASEVNIGDTVIVGTGAVIPIDGTVLGGEATVNEASMSGESTPIPKVRGDSVLSGTLIEEGRIRIYAEHVGHKTAAARIADYVEQSLTSKSEAQLQASRLADKLVPFVLGLAGTSFILTQDLERTASVLQADYSCALKLATPVAFKSAMYAAGQAGILVKGATALERLSETDTFVFDKTGTLTTGLLDVTDSITLDPAFTADDLICLAASVEEHYFHPLAAAVVAAAKNTHGRHFDHAEVEFVVAHGVASEIDGKRIVIGSRHFVEDDEGITVAPHDEIIADLYRSGKTLLYIGYGGTLIGLLALKDRVRENAAAVIARLRELGVKRILMLTGDHQERARELAEQLGLDDYRAELLPEQKADIIKELSQTGAKIAFIGDGINDAPALAGAHVGFAMEKGADIARMTADIALLEDNIARVADAKSIANQTMKLIDTNYKLAVGVNSSILGAAALGLLRPIAAATLHNGSTIGILLNALLGRGKTGGH